MMDIDRIPPTTSFVTERQQQGETDSHFSFPTEEVKGEGQNGAESTWNGLQATELDMVVEGAVDTLQSQGAKPPSSNKSAAFRKGRIIRMGSATLWMEKCLYINIVGRTIEQANNR